MTEINDGMTIEQLQGWMKLINTPMLELILTVGAGKPQWYKDAMVAEIQRRKESRDDRQGSNENTFRPG